MFTKKKVLILGSNLLLKEKLEATAEFLKLGLEVPDGQDLDDLDSVLEYLRDCRYVYYVVKATGIAPNPLDSYLMGAARALNIPVLFSQYIDRLYFKSFCQKAIAIKDIARII